MSENRAGEWPNPREFPHYTKASRISPPEIPTAYTIYGLKFQRSETHVRLASEDYENLDLNEIKAMVKNSYDLFKRILKDPENKELLADLRDLHLTMNTKINKAKRWELENLIK